MLGVSKDTVRGDVGEKSPPKKITVSDNQLDNNSIGEYSPPEPEPKLEEELTPEPDVETEPPTETEDESQLFSISGKDLLSIAEQKEKKAHVANNSGENEWYTPSYMIESARRVMGAIDLDPATSELANATVKASQIFTAEENGLEHAWHGNVWMNPPYAQPLITQFSDKMVAELSNINQACVLVNNATDTGWLQNMIKKCNAVCFVKGRVKFIDKNGEPTGAPLQGQVVLYFGNNTKEFIKEFNTYGICLTEGK